MENAQLKEKISMKVEELRNRVQTHREARAGTQAPQTAPEAYLTGQFHALNSVLQNL